MAVRDTAGGPSVRSELRRDADGCWPVVMALVIILIGLLFGGLVTPVGTPRAIGVAVSRSSDGSNWILTFVSVPTGLSQNSTTLSLYAANGSPVLGATGLYQLEGTGVDQVEYVPIQMGAAYTTCSAGDRILLSTSAYPSGSQYSIANGGSVLASGTLQ